MVSSGWKYKQNQSFSIDQFKSSFNSLMVKSGGRPSRQIVVWAAFILTQSNSCKLKSLSHGPIKGKSKRIKKKLFYRPKSLSPQNYARGKRQWYLVGNKHQINTNIELNICCTGNTHRLRPTGFSLYRNAREQNHALLRALGEEGSR